MEFDVLIIGGGAAGMSCALVLGSAKKKPFAAEKRIGIIMHQRSSALDGALFNNVLGIEPGTTGTDLLQSGRDQLEACYPHVNQIEKEKVTAVLKTESGYKVQTNKGEYGSKLVVVAVGPSNLFNIEGLMDYVEPHPNLPPAKQRIRLKNENHLVTEGLYVAGVLAGWRSQFAMAAGSGAHVATDILTLWNNGNTAMVHDSVPKK
jgi:thioredoxin reductase